MINMSLSKTKMPNFIVNVLWHILKVGDTILFMSFLTLVLKFTLQSIMQYI